MNLNHRVADRTQETGMDMVMRKITYPLTILIPIAVLALSIYSAWQYFGEVWDIGSFSTSFIPFTSRILAQLFSTDVQVVRSTIIVMGYILGPLAFYLLVYAVTSRHLPAVITGVATILPIFPFATNTTERLSLALVEKDGAHILGLTLIPFIVLVFLRYLKKGDSVSLIIYELCAGILALVSIFSVFILSIYLLFISLSEALVGGGRVKLWRFLISSLLLLVVTIVIYNIFLFSLLTSDAGRSTLVVLFNLLPMSFFLVPILGTFAFLIFDRKPTLQPVFLSLGLAIMFGLLHLVETSFVDLPILNQRRYAAELGFALPFFLSVVFTWMFDLLRVGKLVKKWPLLFKYREGVAFGLAILVLVVLVGSIIFIPREL